MVSHEGQMDSAWSKEEFSGIDFNDKWLNTRFIKLSEALWSQPFLDLFHCSPYTSCMLQEGQFLDCQLFSLQSWCYSLQRGKLYSAIKWRFHLINGLDNF
jgi:hypothetical protein